MSTPSDLLSAIYAGKLDDARAIARTRPIDACEAAALGDDVALRDALARDAAAHAGFSGDGWTPLHLAGFFGNDDCAAALLDAGASLGVLSTNGTGNTPLHAALAGKISATLVRRLLDAGADPNARGATGITPLHLAASRGNVELCTLLLERGAERGATMDDGTTPAGMAAQRGHEAAAEMLGAH